MTILLPEDEEIYRQNKIDSLKKTLQDLAVNVEFIWVGDASRRRVIFQIDNKNNLGFFKERTKELIEIDEYPLAEKSINLLIKPLKIFLKKQQQNFINQVVVTSYDNGLDIVFRINRKADLNEELKFINFSKEHFLNCSFAVKQNLIPLFFSRKNQIFCGDLKLNLEGDIFLQATKSGLEHIINFLRTEISAQKDVKKIADIYSGFGVYSFALYNLKASFSCFEGSQSMVDVIKSNAKNLQLSQKIQAQCRDLYGDPLTAKELAEFDNVIINPPRNGAEPQIKNIAKSKIKSLQYISCNPETFARDAKNLIDLNYNIVNIFALDQFYSTNHLELLASFVKQ
jgi:23S rRNA (uracil1939-C5)-methyltransferase